MIGARVLRLFSIKISKLTKVLEMVWYTKCQENLLIPVKDVEKLPILCGVPVEEFPNQAEQAVREA